MHVSWQGGNKGNKETMNFYLRVRVILLLSPMLITEIFTRVFLRVQDYYD